ncbi:outer membrane beta-barrel protein [Aequorivita sp. SDUM287046]|uniref:Outer membrane beta-barrel protein n=1 Tax=Aequorivita aurantiaca TaxID=3053356 RepID=A0ABT8DGK4_9FLAO|nr:outer membrane beta-barrel protein [Aequorivita aurantiaca]MDN3724516.1 outer membrane beta-barrel protein [Aequorivita aurantiaca]
MENKKDIGDFLKSKLDQGQRIPDESVWEKINTTLDRKSKRRKRAFWLLLPTLTVFGILSLIMFQKTDKSILNKDEKISVEEVKDSLDKTILIETPTNENVSEIKFEKEIEKVAEYTTSEEVEKESKTEPLNQISENKIVSKNSRTKSSNSPKLPNEPEISGKSQKINDSNSLNNNEKNSIENLQNSVFTENNTSLSEVEKNAISKNDSEKIDSTAVAKIEKIKKREKDKKKLSEKDSTEIQKSNTRKWTVMAIAGPVLYNVSEKTSTLDQSLDGAETSGEINFTYGVGVGFNLTEKLSLSFSAIKTKISYSVNNLPSTTSIDSLRIFSISAISGNNVSRRTLSNFAGSDALNLRQEIEYVEMPLQLTYSLTKSRFGTHAFGGFSTLLLTDDRIFAENSRNEELDLGRANNLSRISFSLNAGIGAYYKFSENFTVELNPTFKYQFLLLDSASRNATGVVFGFYAGLKYNFNTN